MEEKNRMSVRIAGRFLTVVTDEDPEAVRHIEKTLNERVDAMGKASPRMNTRDGKIDAVILCAVEALNRERAAERRAAQAEEAARQAEEKIRRLRMEYARFADGGKTRKKSAHALAPESENGNGDGMERRPERNEEEYGKTLARIRAILEAIRDRGGKE